MVRLTLFAVAISSMAYGQNTDLLEKYRELHSEGVCLTTAKCNPPTLGVVTVTGHLIIPSPANSQPARRKILNRLVSLSKDERVGIVFDLFHRSKAKDRDLEYAENTSGLEYAYDEAYTDEFLLFDTSDAVKLVRCAEMYNDRKYQLLRNPLQHGLRYLRSLLPAAGLIGVTCPKVNLMETSISLRVFRLYHNARANETTRATLPFLPTFER